MIRTQVQLTAEQAESLRRVAARRGISVSALVREGVERVLGDDQPDRRMERALAAVGRFASGKRDVSREHDRDLAEAYEE
jgi:hypothetical protein